jgi:hypothetical protein
VDRFWPFLAVRHRGASTAPLRLSPPAGKASETGDAFFPRRVRCRTDWCGHRARYLSGEIFLANNDLEDQGREFFRRDTAMAVKTKQVPLSAYERKSLERRLDELKERLQTLLDQRLPREELVQRWQIVLDEMSDINDKLGED